MGAKTLCIALLGLYCYSYVTCLPTLQYNAADTCDADNCKLPDCRCSDVDVPGGLDPKSIPQTVLLTFDDGVNTINIKYYRELFNGRVNPDGCPVAATYFVAHEYTDYSLVHELHAHGHEIALHSITHESNTDRWRNASVDLLKKEFSGERDLIANFAKIPKEDIKGIRMPFLQLAGDNSYIMLNEEGFLYDCSWPTQDYMAPPLWPYTLDYLSIQDCTIGPCPEKSIPGYPWVVPMVDWKDDQDQFCVMVDACQNVPDNVDGLFEFMKRNFHRHYDSTRAPFGFYVHAAWFDKRRINYDAYKKFVDYLQSLPDVYLVGINRMLDWVRKPSTLENLATSWPACQPTKNPDCQAKNCELKKGEEYRYMNQCLPRCPKTYPWLDNPLGQ